MKNHIINSSKHGLAAIVLLFSMLVAPLSIVAPVSAANKGDLKVHEYGTPAETENNDPKVCAFNFEGFSFAQGQTGYIMITVQGNDAPHGADAGPFNFGPTDANGYAASQYFNIAGAPTVINGHYTATLYGKGVDGKINLADEKAKSKDFKISCDENVTPTDVCPNISGDQAVVPNGMVVTNAGDCATPGTGGGQVLGTSTTNTPPSTPVVAGSNAKELVNTGSAASLNLAVGAFILGSTALVTILARKRQATVAVDQAVTAFGE